MTGISIGGSSSPLARVQNTLARDVAAGSVAAADQPALASAIGDIGAQLSAGSSGTAAGTTSATATTGAAPTSMKDRVDSLIDAEVSSGKLTSDQATQLKGVFEQAHARMHGGTHGAHGHHGGGGLAALTDATGDGTAATTTATGSTATGSTAATNPLEAAATTAANALEAFITQFKSAVSANGPYGSSGTANNSATSLLVNAIG